MSAGLMCLRCRRYLDGDDACTCTAPIPSEDGVTPVGDATEDGCPSSARLVEMLYEGWERDEPEQRVHPPHLRRGMRRI